MVRPLVLCVILRRSFLGKLSKVETLPNELTKQTRRTFILFTDCREVPQSMDQTSSPTPTLHKYNIGGDSNLLTTCRGGSYEFWNECVGSKHRKVKTCVPMHFLHVCREWKKVSIILCFSLFPLFGNNIHVQNDCVCVMYTMVKQMVGMSYFFHWNFCLYKCIYIFSRMIWKAALT